MFTGLLPRASGIVDRPDATPHAARAAMEALSAIALLPEVMRDAGYAHRGRQREPLDHRESGFAIGFESFESVSSGRQAHLHSDRLLGRLAWDCEAWRAAVDDGAEPQPARSLRDWLDRGRSTSRSSGS